MSKHIAEFNELVKVLANRLARECPNSIIANNISNLDTLIKQYPNKLIELFVINVLPDQQKIEEADDEYFLNKSYDNLTGSNNTIIKQMFEFKTFWKKLLPKTKIECIDYLKVLCMYASEYFLEKYPG